MKLAINRGWTASLAIATALLLSGAAGASDGVIEINQTCATTTGCVANDSGGFPVFIGGFGAPRSYILTSDLVPTNSGSVLFIDGDEVSLDMNGFSILCSPTSTIGIRYGSPQKNLHVSNGNIVGCQEFGIGPSGSFAIAGAGSRIEGLTVDSCNRGGIAVGTDSVVEDSAVIDSGFANTTVVSSGIRLGTNSIARNNIVSGANRGINCVAAECLISGNVARGNNDGIYALKSTVINNTSTGNTGSAITAFDGSSVIGNTVRNNAIGLNLHDDPLTQQRSSYRGNSVVGSTTAAVVASRPNSGGGEAINLGHNTCLGPGALSPCPFP
jgi:parallel beta-helix repeat protein